MKIRWRAAISLVPITVLTLSACGTSSDGEGSDRTLNVGYHADASSLDPIRGNSGSDHMLLYPIYDTLVSFNDDLEAKPGLAKSWDFDDPTELTLHLREGVEFHDGTQLDAKAVKFNLERAQGDESNIAEDVESVKDITVDNKYAVTLHLAYPDSSLLLTLADRAGMMVSPKAAKAADGDLSTKPVGAGGWEFVDWNRGDSIEYTKFKDYWDSDAQRVSGIKMNILPDPKTRASSLQSGEQDIAFRISGSELNKVENDSNITIDKQQTLYIDQVYLNKASEEFEDPRVRKAMSMAIDRQALVKSGYFGLGEPASGFVPDDYWASPPESVEYGHDVDEAKKMIADAGADGMTFNMLANDDSETVRVAEILKEQWSKIGVTVNVMPREVTQASSDYFDDRKHPALLSAWTGRPDPALTYRLMFSAGGYFNTSGGETPDLEKALDNDAQETTATGRKPWLDKAAEAVYKDTPIIPLSFRVEAVGLREDISGFHNNLLGKAKMTGVTLK